MSFDLLGDLDWLAMIAAAIAYFVVGAAWYAPSVFGRAWMAAGRDADARGRTRAGTGDLRGAARRQRAPIALG
jgi:hypothetical protein